ncbi:hypothetical protein [Roseicyclus mahoneyensis]|uniref:hypothetical protein n=1 Tax=Roseicyclus mahoneyensis TaxID=164332 RepID=UPI000D6BF4A3|nr:hypothetical protein [Roseicyclus mahoneyensis]
MTDIFNDHDALAYADRSVAQAYKALETAVELLERTLDAARVAEICNETDVVKDVRAVGAAFQLAIVQEAKARDAGSQRYGRRGGGVLDLDAARDEVCRRLARLRAARDGDDVSAGVE